MRASTFPMRRSASSWADASARASTCNAWDGSFVPGTASAPSSTSCSCPNPRKRAARKGGGAILLPEHDLPLRVLDDRGFIDSLGPEDEPWLRVLLAELERFSGRRRRELAERLAEPLPCETPYFKRRAASRVLLRLWRGRPVS